MLTLHPQPYQDRRRHLSEQPNYPLSFTDLPNDDLALLYNTSIQPTCARDFTIGDSFTSITPADFDFLATQPFMTTTYNPQNPAIRVQRSTPAPPPQMGAYEPWSYTPEPLQSYNSTGMVDSKPGYNQQFPLSQRIRYQQDQNKNRRIVSDNLSAMNKRMHELGQPNYENNMEASFAMKQAMMEGDDDVPYSHSSRQSVSSFGNSPATPRTTVGDDFDVKPLNDLHSSERSPVDSVFQSYHHAQAMPQFQTQHTPQFKTTLLSPNMAAQAAHMARSQSANVATSSDVSPFRKGSPLAPVEHSFTSPRQRFGGQLHAQRTNDAAVVANAMKSMSQDQDPEPKTISPKDALLDYNETDEDKQMPLFPPDDNSHYTPPFQSSGNSVQSIPQEYHMPAGQRYANMASSQPDWNMPVAATTSGQNSFAFGPSLMPTSVPMNNYSNTLAFSSPHYRPASTVHPHDPTPDFPAHLTSMESSASENNGFHDSISSSPSDLIKPGPSAANTGTYSCSVQGCPLRFETPQKLQKHKREAHRQVKEAITPGVGSGMTPEQLLARNSQTGPHKCDRINPTTGKPCNISFSRPYDLTRHEDTIHNGRKQKVRCHLCEEEKTFSRNDALTRHMRVVHPDVDFPGKHRRRGQSSS